MAIIEKRVYRQVEWHLHHAASLISVAKAEAFVVRHEVLGGGAAAPTGGNGSSKGRLPGDRTGKAAMRLVEADEKVEAAILWVSIIEELRAQFDGRPESALFTDFYGREISVTEYAAAAFVDRQTVNNYRDKIVVSCALLAAESGLIKIRGALNDATA